MKKADQPSATRNFILDAARCFAEKSFSACSMREIAKGNSADFKARRLRNDRVSNQYDTEAMGVWK
ncbi:MAG: TetR/AcrR family transcriptional regulator [Desulfovibrio sp.]|nr:TetR/AcrR family transcriptional regulator [Desulfovibrio sp.]